MSVEWYEVRLLRWLEARRASQATCVFALQCALERQLAEPASEERATATGVLESQLQEAHAEQRAWEVLGQDDFEWDVAGEYVEGRTAKACEILRRESQFRETLRAIEWTDEYKQARVCLRRGDWKKADELVADADGKARGINHTGAGRIPLWFLWQCVCSEGIGDS